MAGLLEIVADVPPVLSYGERFPLSIFGPSGALQVAKQMNRSVVIGQTRINALGKRFRNIRKDCNELLRIALIRGKTITLETIAEYRYLVAGGHGTAALYVEDRVDVRSRAKIVTNLPPEIDDVGLDLRFAGSNEFVALKQPRLVVAASHARINAGVPA